MGYATSVTRTHSVAFSEVESNAKQSSNPSSLVASSDSGSLKGWKNATKDLPAQYHGICVPTAKNNIDAAAEKQISKPPTQTSKATNVVKDLVTGKVIAKEVVVYGPDGLKVISCTKNAEATPAPSKIVEKKDKPAAVPPHVRAAMAKATAEAGEDA
ncbi:hypothetical protein Slin15195_G018750 [Septoria linicola]|uniref:Uncharacterized protein n=1 Tax=Septoria linicola TaxID=215465 RepID=A0A9Q9EE96_9PEZI|nr:hypothetical protein Slin15195_G018750 [Septoria linicola]